MYKESTDDIFMIKTVFFFSKHFLISSKFVTIYLFVSWFSGILQGWLSIVHFASHASVIVLVCTGIRLPVYRGM